MNIFPSSPVWADFDRTPIWAEEVNYYDSGERQGSTAWQRPLYRYAIKASNITEVKQSSLHNFWNQQKGQVTPFLFKDPYDYKANGITQPAAASGSGFYLRQVNSYKVIPDSGNFLIRDSRSGNLVSGSHYVASLDNGWIQVLVAQSSTWVASFEFFRKVAFSDQYSEQSKIWNIFDTTIVIQELIPNA
jgi:hypothetical protein